MEGRGWDVASHRREILRSRDLSSCTLFRAVFSGHSDGPYPNVLLAAASSDGSLASFSFLSCISAGSAAAQVETAAALVDPVCVVQAQSSTAYDVRFYPDPQHFRDLEPAFDLVNPQHDGRWGALSPIPENNAIAINKQDGSIMVAAGDACAYCWDVETGKCKITIKGHADCLQSVAVRESNCQDQRK